MISGTEQLRSRPADQQDWLDDEELADAPSFLTRDIPVRPTKPLGWAVAGFVAGVAIAGSWSLMASGAPPNSTETSRPGRNLGGFPAAGVERGAIGQFRRPAAAAGCTSLTYDRATQITSAGGCRDDGTALPQMLEAKRGDAPAYVQQPSEVLPWDTVLHAVTGTAVAR